MSRSGRLVVLVVSMVAGTGCKKSEGPVWMDFEISGHSFTAHLPAPIVTTAPEQIKHDNNGPVVGFRFTNVEKFGTVEIESTPPSLMPPESVRDFKDEKLADGDLYSWWVPSSGGKADKSYTLYYRRTIDGVAVTCGSLYVQPSQVDVVKDICTSLKSGKH